MQDRLPLASPGIHASLLFESPMDVCSRIFRELKPRTAPPRFRVDFCRFANANSLVKLEDGLMHLRISDLLEGAPAPVLESLIYILIAKLYRKPIPKMHAQRYRLFLNRKDVRRQMHLVRQIRGRKFVSGPRGAHVDLDPIFNRLNEHYFNGLLGKPQLGWSRTPSRSMLGHFDPSHNAIIISRIFDDPKLDPLMLEYVMYHEMLHLRYPVEHGRTRRCVHTPEFRKAEKQFERLTEAKAALKHL
jgi:hypothetical protein